MTQKKGLNPNLATVVMVNSLSEHDKFLSTRAPLARAVIIRRPKGTPRNTILVTAQTTPDDLAEAVSQLMSSRVSHGSFVKTEMRTYINPSKPLGVGNRERQHAQADLEKLASAKQYNFAQMNNGIGKARAIAVRMAPVSQQKAKLTR